MILGVQCKRYGVDHMTDWVHSLPDKLRISGRLDFVESKPVRGDLVGTGTPRTGLGSTYNHSI
jgi:hypothetical protein